MRRLGLTEGEIMQAISTGNIDHILYLKLAEKDRAILSLALRDAQKQRNLFEEKNEKLQTKVEEQQNEMRKKDDELKKKDEELK